MGSIKTMWSKFKKMFRVVKNYHNQLYLVFRVMIGLLFAQHGAEKLLGWFGGTPVNLFSVMELAGFIELVGGLAISLGLFTRLVASIAALEMLIAYLASHATRGFAPIVNGGELAALYFAAFLVLVGYGAKKWGLEKAVFKKEMF